MQLYAKKGQNKLHLAKIRVILKTKITEEIRKCQVITDIQTIFLIRQTKSLGVIKTNLHPRIHLIERSLNKMNKKTSSFFSRLA